MSDQEHHGAAGTRSGKRTARGVTLIEVMLSMAVVLVGMMALFRVLSVAQKGAQQSQRFSQALARGQDVIEAMRMAPPSVLQCLATNPASSWNNCEALCRQWYGRYGAVVSPESCVFSTLAIINNNQNQDGTGQYYSVIYDANNFNDGSSWVQNTVLGKLVFEAQVVVAWDDNNLQLPAATSCGAAGGTIHCVTLRTSVFREVN